MALLINLWAFVGCAWFAYSQNMSALFFHFDGACTFIEIRNQLLLGSSLLSFTNDHYQSIGNIQFLQNAEFLFFFWPIGWFSDDKLARLVVYLLIATIVFLSAYALARLLSQSRQVGLIAGWILGVLATPFVPPPFFYPILWVAPAMVLLIPSPVIALWLLRKVGQTTIVVDILAGLGLIGLALYVLSANPSIMAVLGPGAAPYVVLSFVIARSRSEQLRKLAVLAAVAIVGICLKWPWFLLGLFSQTAPHVFPGDFTVVYQNAIYISIFFHGSIGWAGPALVVMACAGAILSLRRGGSELRAAAWLLLGIFTVLLAFRLAFLLFPRWIFPPPLYFEIASWPLYGLFTAVAVRRLFGLLTSLLVRIRPAFRVDFSAGWILPMSAVILTVFLSAINPPATMDYPFPPRSTPIVEVLRTNIALTAHSRFNGRVATIIPTKQDAGDPWSQQFTAAVAHARSVGNDELSAGLWYYQIPTLFEYNPFLSPLFHMLTKRALQRPPTPHQRNITVLTHPDVRIMGLLGVRYLIMNEADEPIGERRAAAGDAPHRWVLSELANPNLATYSPTTLEVRRELATTLDFLLDQANDLSQTAVVRQPVAGPLMPLRSSSLTMDGADLHITAQSGGRSLVIVPLEFSRCIEFRLAPATTGEFKAELIRVNGLLTGILFERDLDAVLAFRIGPLHNPSCRWQDYQDLQEMLL